MFKRQLFIIIPLFFWGGLCLAQSNGSIIGDMRIKYQHIRDNVKTYDTTMIDIWGESTEGGEATAYYDGNNIKLIVVILFGETGKRKTEYYFNEEQLFFAFNANYTYNSPIYLGEKEAKEFNDNIAFDPNKTTVKEDRYYFYKDKLLLWFDSDKKEVDLSIAANSIVGKNLVAHAYKMKGKLIPNRLQDD